MASRGRWLELQGKKAARKLANDWRDIVNQRVMAKVFRAPRGCRDEASQWVAVEDRRRRRVAFEETAKGILRYLEDSEDLKVGVTVLQEQLGISEEAGANEKGQKIFENFRQEEEDVCIASWARWNAQLKGLAELDNMLKYEAGNEIFD